MNIWERNYQCNLDSVKAMVEYAESINSDHESKEFSDALRYWAENLECKFKEDWNKQHK